MIKITKILGIIFLLTTISTTKLHATTWNEPWAREVIIGASSFVLAKIISTDPEKGIKIFVLKTLGGIELKDTILVSDFYLLKICSSTGGHGPEFHTKRIDSCYFFIKQNEKAQYCIATPTTGFDYVLDGEVAATFRHSYHQASASITLYEKTMTAVFNNYHNQPYDNGYITEFVNKYLSKKPAGFSEDEIGTFFMQHVALECIYHLKLNISENLVLPFLNDKQNFHNQVSAARAMSAFNTQTNKQTLLQAISDTTKRTFVRVMCVWSLSELAPTELKIELQKLEQTASDESDSFGGNIMDPRVCTSIPSLKRALGTLLKKV